MNKYWNIIVRTLCAAGFCLSSFLPIRSMPEEKPDDAICFQIFVPKTKYRLGEKATVSLIVVNRGATPIYLSRGFICGKSSGYVDFRILNSQGQNVKNGGCDAFEFLIPLDKVKQEVTESHGWLRLDAGEIYGEEEDLEAPAKKGSYRLVAELIPPGFTKQQKELLAAEQIHVLRARYIAPAITIIVK